MSQAASQPITVTAVLAQRTTQKGATLAALSEDRPLLLVFLRQFG